MNNATKLNGVVAGPSLSVPIRLTAATAGKILAIVNPEAQPIIVDRVELLVKTVATATATISIGQSATDALSANLIDGQNVNTAPVNFVYDNYDNGGTLGKSKQYLAATDLLTVYVASGDANGLVAQLMVDYKLVNTGGSLV